MAARLNGAHAKDIRDKIKTSQLINRLQDNGLAEREFLTTGQIASINAVLDRVLPKLASVTVAGDKDNPLAVVGRIELVAGRR